jgi:Maltokinase N-terminal cap domain
MALLHKATVDPTKRELMTAWLATRPWAQGFDPVRTIASYRFDDPAGEVGLEGALLVNDAGAVAHVPLSYRGAPLEGGDAHLVGTTQHSVLGKRWVYDACGDPVWATALATAIATGDGGAEQYFEVDGERRFVEPRMTVQGSGRPGAAVPATGAIDDVRDEGSTTVTRCRGVELVVVRMIGTAVAADQTLTGRWGDASGVLAGLRRA